MSNEIYINPEKATVITDAHTSVYDSVDYDYITISYVDEETNGSLSKRGVQVCESFFPSLCEATVEIDIIIGESITTGTLSLEKVNPSMAGFSSWSLIGTVGETSISVPIKERLLEPNKKKKRADLNLLSLSTSLESAGIPIVLCSNETAFSESLNARSYL